MKIKRLKLNALSAEGIRQKEMNAIIGGDTCGCLFAGQPGGSSTKDNQSANFQKGYFSEYNYYICDDYGNWEFNDPPIPIYSD